jgi:exopolysaccharide production protein ExoQ
MLAHMNAPRSQRQHLLEIVTGGFMLFVLTNPLQFVIKGIVPGAAALSDPFTSRAIYSNVALQLIVKAAVLAVFGIGAITRLRASAAVLFRAPLLCAFFLYAVASIEWSDTPSNSINDVIYLITAITAGVATAAWFDSLDCARVFATAGLFIVFTSLIMVIFFPSYGVHQATELSAADLAGAWRGVYTHKNTLGQITAMFLVVYVFNGRELLGSRVAQLAAAALTLLLVIESRSASALVLVALGTIGYVFVFMLRGAVQLSLLIVSPVAIFISEVVKEKTLVLLGRGADLSGRTDIWEAAYRMILERPLLGYGYGSATMGGFTSYIIARFKAPNSHNGYIELALSAGLIGSLILYSAIATAVYRMIRSYEVSGSNELLIRTFAAFLITWSIANLSEISLGPSTPMGSLGFLVIVIGSSLSYGSTIVAGEHRQAVRFPVI